MKFFEEQFDKFLLVFLFACSITLTVVLAHHGGDEQYVAWGKEMTAGILGALLLRINTDGKGKPDTKTNGASL